MGVLSLIGKIYINGNKKKKKRTIYLYGKKFAHICYSIKRGLIEFQIFNFINKIERLTSHLERHRDYFSQRGRRKILGKHRLLVYLSNYQRKI